MEVNGKSSRKTTLLNISYVDLPSPSSEHVRLIGSEGYTSIGTESQKTMSPLFSQKTFNFLPVISENDESTPNHLQSKLVAPESIFIHSGTKKASSKLPTLNLKASSIDKLISTKNVDKPLCFSPKVRKSLQMADGSGIIGSSLAKKRNFRKADTLQIITKFKGSPKVENRHHNETKTCFSPSHSSEVKLMKKHPTKEGGDLQNIYRATTLSMTKSSSYLRKRTNFSKSPLSQLTIHKTQSSRFQDSERSPSLKSQYQLHFPSYRMSEV